MNIFIMLIGLSASGKSTYARGLEARGYKVHSSDALRAEMWGDESEQKNPSAIFEELQKRIIKDLREGLNCVMDATSLSSKRRISFLKSLDKINCFKEAAVFAPPVEACIIRDGKRDRSVGIDVILRQLKQFEVPSFHEGWDEISIFERNFKNTPINPTSLMEYDQENPFHDLTLGEHICKAYEYACDHYDPFVQMAIFHHDTGKIYTKAHLNYKREKTPFAHYYGHENVSAYLYLSSNTDTLSDALVIAQLIQWHMRPKDKIFWEKFSQKIDPILKLQLEAVSICDEMGKGE